MSQGGDAVFSTVFGYSRMLFSKSFSFAKLPFYGPLAREQAFVADFFFLHPFLILGCWLCQLLFLSAFSFLRKDGLSYPFACLASCKWLIIHTFFLCFAKSSADSPLMFWASTLAPASRRRLMTVVFPASTAQMQSSVFVILVTKVNYVFYKLPTLKVSFHSDPSYLHPVLLL